VREGLANGTSALLSRHEPPCLGSDPGRIFVAVRPL